MRLELEYQVQEVDDQDDDACSSADLEDLVVGGSLVAERGMEGRWQQQAGDAKS
jgi:hypothetical protein